MPAKPLAYFITFRPYGTWLPGDERGTVDDSHNVPNTPLLPRLPEREKQSASLLKHTPLELNARRRWVVDATIREVCLHRGWELHAVHVRVTHVHVVVTADLEPEPLMNSLKSWCTRRMIEAGVLERGHKAWARHGSTQYLWERQNLDGAVKYVLDMQGSPLPMKPPPGQRAVGQGEMDGGV